MVQSNDKRAPGNDENIAPRRSSGVKSSQGALGHGGMIVPVKPASYLNRCSVRRASVDRSLRSNCSLRSDMESIEEDDVADVDFTGLDAVMDDLARHIGVSPPTSSSMASSWLSGDKIIGKKSSPTTSKGREGSMTTLVRCVVVSSVVGTLAFASLAIGYTIVEHRLDRMDGRGEIVDDGRDNDESQELFEMAERVVLACSEESLDADMSACRDACHSKMCCFETGIYSCEEEEEEDCAVYAGCEALVGFPSDFS